MCQKQKALLYVANKSNGNIMDILAYEFPWTESVTFISNLESLVLIVAEILTFKQTDRQTDMTRDPEQEHIYLMGSPKPPTTLLSPCSIVKVYKNKKTCCKNRYTTFY